MFMETMSTFLWVGEKSSTGKFGSPDLHKMKIASEGLNEKTLFLDSWLMVSFWRAQHHPPEVLHKKADFKNFAIFTGKHLCWSHFLIKLQALTPILKNSCGWLSLYATCRKFHAKLLYWFWSCDALSFLFCSTKRGTSTWHQTKVMREVSHEFQIFKIKC